VKNEFKLSAKLEVKSTDMNTTSRFPVFQPSTATMSALTPADLCGPAKPPLFLNADGSFAFIFPSMIG
jgi:hypothetical protein